MKGLDAVVRGVAVCAAIFGAGLGPMAPGSVLAHTEHGHPARIHEGTCENLGPVAFRLNGVGASVDLDNATLATPTPVNPDLSYQVLGSETAIDGTVDDVLAGAHAVMVYESDEEMVAIACGNVGGAMIGETLVTGLGEVGVPGHVGFAMFAPDGDGARVTVLIGHAMAPVSAGGPVEVDQPHDEEVHENAEDDADHDHEDDGHADDATPEA